MHDFGTFLQKLSSNSGIKFNLMADDGTSIYISDIDVEASERMYIPLLLGKSKAIININKKYEISSTLLKYVIEDKYKELYSIKEQLVIDMLEGKKMSIDIIEENIPIITKGCVLLLVNVEGSKYEALNIIKQIYNEQDVLSIIYGETIIVIGVFEDIKEHAYGIREAIVSDLYCKCYISYGDIYYGKDDMKTAYENGLESILIGKKFGIEDGVLDYNKLIFEKFIYNINSKLKQELLNVFREKFNVFDSEIVTTIEEFIKCGLNITDAAKRLYIHRNTLIYRLDKIAKDTGFDIRNFKEATVFIIAFLVWKESK